MKPILSSSSTVSFSKDMKDRGVLNEGGDPLSGLANSRVTSWPGRLGGNRVDAFFEKNPSR